MATTEIYVRDRDLFENHIEFKPGAKIVTLTTGRYRLIERDPSRRAWIAIEIDGPLSYLLVTWALIKKWGRNINYRLLMTAQVWELLDTPIGKEIKWSNFKLLKRVRNGND